MTLQTSPPLEPIRALHIAAMDALITASLLRDQHLQQSQQIKGQCARLLLNKLQVSGLATVTEHAGHCFLKIHGITGAGQLGAPLLKSWQESARIRLGCVGWPE